MENLIGKTLGKYEILEEIGRGGMGAVYKAYDPVLDRYVAIKVLAPHLVWEEGFVARFFQEARTAAKLHHSNIVTIYDMGEQEGIYYIVMQYIEGEPLSTVIRREGLLPLDRVVRIVGQVASALEAAHRRGLVHRDVKPGNILVGAGDRAVLTDFGIAKALEGTRLTRTGMMIGTPGYISPEQVKGGEVGPASDQYALEVVTYEMLAGRPPFEGDTTTLLYKHVNEPPPPLRTRNKRIPGGVEKVVMKALAKEPGDRWSSVKEFAGKLREGVEGRDRPAVGAAGGRRHPALGESRVRSDYRASTAGGKAVGMRKWLMPAAAVVMILVVVLMALTAVRLGRKHGTLAAKSAPSATPTLIPVATPTPVQVHTTTPILTNISVPTAIPTLLPTAAPTAGFTFTPSPKPTLVPVYTTTPILTNISVPTAIPTLLPTAAPTAGFTFTPSPDPTLVLGNQKDVTPSHPCPRIHHGWVYDPFHHRFVLFGGWDGTRNLNDTWEFDGARWYRIDTPQSPPPRSGFGMVYDSYRRRVVLFGGMNDSGRVYGDTWEYDGTTWTQVNAIHAPRARTGAGMTYDASRARVVLFGGADQPGTSYHVFSDTWEYDGIDWEQKFPAHSPSARCCGEISLMVYESRRERVLLHAGWVGHGCGHDTWEYDGNDWYRTTNGPSRYGHAMAYDSDQGRILFHGGSDCYRVVNDTWEYNSATATWTQISTINPTAQCCAPIAYDPISRKFLMYGGADDDGNMLDGLWAYDPALRSWERVK